MNKCTIFIFFHSKGFATCGEEILVPTSVHVEFVYFFINGIEFVENP